MDKKMESIEKALEQMDGVNKKLFVRREIKDLPNILWENETLEKIADGMLGNSTGVLVATNSRLIFLNKKFYGGMEVIDYDYSQISSIEYETGWVFGKITIYSHGVKAKIEQMEKMYVRDIAEYVRARISAPKEHANVKKEEVRSVVDQLKELKGLMDEGILSEEEFKREKEKILG